MTDQDTREVVKWLKALTGMVYCIFGALLLLAVIGAVMADILSKRC